MIALSSTFAFAVSACAFSVFSFASAVLIWDSSLSWIACFANFTSVLMLFSSPSYLVDCNCFETTHLSYSNAKATAKLLKMLESTDGKTTIPSRIRELR